MGGACTCSTDPQEIVNSNIKNTTNIIQINHKEIEQALNQREENENNLILINRNFTHSFVKKPYDFSRLSIQSIENSPQYIKGQCIGKGFSGQVYSGLSLNTGEIVAIKTIKFNGDRNTIELKKQNVRDSVIRLSHIKHKNIIKYMCTQEAADDELDLIIEYCNGGSIKQLIEKFNAFDEKLIKLYVKQILEGLVYLHDLGIVHRNIKNTNILVDGTGVVKITDLVVSNILIGDEPEKILWYSTMNGKECPYCVAPEIVLKSKELDQSVDIWSLGCIVIEMATQKPPWSGVAKTVEEVLNVIATSNVPPKFPSHLSKECKEFLYKCLKKSPHERETARKLLEHDFFKTNLPKEIISSAKKRISIESKIHEKFYKPIKQENLKSNLILKNHIILRKDEKEKFNSKSEVINTEVVIVKDPNQDTTDSKNFFNLINENMIVEEQKKQSQQQEDNIINFLNDESNGAFFSISMSIQQDTLPSNPYVENKYNNHNNNNNIISNQIEEIMDENSSLNNQAISINDNKNKSNQNETPTSLKN